MSEYSAKNASNAIIIATCWTCEKIVTGLSVVSLDDYPDDWYCSIYYDVTTRCEGSKSCHSVEIQHIYINFQEVKVAEKQESVLTTVLTNRANEEFQFEDTDIYPDYATSKIW